MPAVHTLLVRHSRDNITGRIFGYNQSFMYLGNVAGPLLGAAVSALIGYRWVFFATALVVLINVVLLKRFYRRPRTLLAQPADTAKAQNAARSAIAAELQKLGADARAPGVAAAHMGGVEVQPAARFGAQQVAV
nr:drug efflux system protein MdtG [Candidatus Pantoea persica]